MDEVRAALADMNASGKHKFDPVRFCYIESLVKRAEALPGMVADALWVKARSALTGYQSTIETAVTEAQAIARQHPDQKNTVDGFLAEQDFGGLGDFLRASRKPAQQREEALQKLSALTQELLHKDLHVPDSTSKEELVDFLARQERDVLVSVNGGAAIEARSNPNELKSLARFRKSWEKVRADRVATSVANEAPDNPGPLNQHMLAIRTITKMRALSPAYFNRFASYMDSLLWLEKAGHRPKKKAKSKK